jgi:ABC-2 type transport system permease protein
VALAFAVGSLAGGLAYCSLFALLSVMTRHAVVIGLLYLLLWEGLLGGLLDGVRWLSVTRWAGAIAEEVAGQLSLVEDLGTTYAVVATAVVVVLGTWLTGRRLQAFNLTGDE